MPGKRIDYLSWDEYFMGVVGLASLRSYHDSRGACLVDSNNRILSIGSSQAPYSIYGRNVKELGKYILSPVSNALFTFRGKRTEFEDGTMYLSDFPTPEDARNLAQARLNRIIYLNNSEETEEKDIARRILDCAEIEVMNYMGSDYKISDYRNFLIDLQTLIKKYIKKTDGPVSAEEYYMAISVLSALRSKDPSTQVGSCLIDENGRVISVGYNGAPYKMSDDILPWHSNGEITGIKKDIKDYYPIHAEFNTLDNYRGQQSDLNRMTLYVTYSPCVPCSNRLGIVKPKELVWLREYSTIDPETYEICFLETDIHAYDENYKIWTKNYYKEFFNETTKVIKKNLGKPGKMI